MKNVNKNSSDVIFSDQVLVLTLNAPKANVLDIEMVSKLTRTVQDVGDQAYHQSDCFSGAGENFSSEETATRLEESLRPVAWGV